MNLPAPALEFLFRLVIEVGPPLMASGAAARGGQLRVVPLRGGRFEGPSLRGEVLGSAGADWLRVEPDGTAHMDVRLVLRTAEGEEVFMSYTGLRTGPAEALARLAAGEAVDPAAYYFRTAIRFETAAPRLDWMNRVLAVGTGMRPPEGPTYDVYAVR
ncbi:DUF3237 domain-containing protein [Roseococcus sp. DSY-14]|uniref:DUF3237 domain-containing protein n=1 Tax=Roseococcus sp. DSY-14 TaxID=3369650 RepID=UPI00387B1BCB